MDAHCYLEVDVNGEEVFVVDKRVISSYSGKIKKLFGKSKDVTRCLKLIFHDFPGGPLNFELITRFCYNKGKANINPSNISNLTCAAHFMEMSNFLAGTENLCEQTEKSLEQIKYWTWSDVFVALRQCQNLLPRDMSLVIIDKLLISVIGKIVSSCETSSSPSDSSPDSSGFRQSSETRSSESLKNTFFRTTWRFEDLLSLNTSVIEMLARMMVSRNFDNGIISKFLFYYQKSRFGHASPDEKIKIIEAVVEMLYALDIRCVSYKSLFEFLRVGLSVKFSRRCKDKLVSMIGSLLDQATLDNLLVQSPAGKRYFYDVNLVLSFLKSFTGKGVCCVPLSRLKKVASLIDLYLAEIAPDPHLKPLKFLAVIKALPDSTRDSFDGVYHAVNLYLEVHSSLSEEQKIAVSFGINHEKLSTEAFNQLTQTANFPAKCATKALISRQSKLKSFQEHTEQDDRLSRPSKTAIKGSKGECSQQIVIYAQKLSLTDENEKLKSHLQRMQCRVLELEKVCRKMQFQMAKMMKSKLSSSHSNASKSVHMLCSQD